MQMYSMIEKLKKEKQQIRLKFTVSRCFLTSNYSTGSSSRPGDAEA